MKEEIKRDSKTLKIFKTQFNTMGKRTSENVFLEEKLLKKWFFDAAFIRFVLCRLLGLWPSIGYISILYIDWLYFFLWSVETFSITTYCISPRMFTWQITQFHIASNYFLKFFYFRWLAVPYDASQQHSKSQSADAKPGFPWMCSFLSMQSNPEHFNAKNLHCTWIRANLHL